MILKQKFFCSELALLNCILLNTTIYSFKVQMLRLSKHSCFKIVNSTIRRLAFERISKNKQANNGKQIITPMIFLLCENSFHSIRMITKKYFYTIFIINYIIIWWSSCYYVVIYIVNCILIVY